MSKFARQNKKQLRNFESRAAYSADVRVYRDWRYITVHPFADEPELLERLSLKPADCTHADVWWHTGRNIVLLQTAAAGSPPYKTRCSWFGDPPYLSVIADIQEPVTTLRHLHQLMDRIEETGLPRRYNSQYRAVLFEN